MNFGLERGTVSGQIYHKKFVEDNATKEFVKLPLRGIKDKRKHDDKGKNGVLPQIYSPFLRQAVHNLFTD